MASKSTNRQIHVSPGIYFTESEISAATTSLGITNLGLAGETTMGPAFQPIEVSSWSQFQSVFGGTDTSKFRGSQFPKYELPYIAKTYLEESQNLKVCRVLGLSGVNAGPAWIISAYGTSGQYKQDNPMVVAVLRSRGEHEPVRYVGAANGDEECDDQYSYDNILYYAKSVTIEKSKTLNLNNGCVPTFGTTDKDFVITVNDYGTFTLKVTLNESAADGSDRTVEYAVSLNPTDKNYIYNVLGSDPEVGDAEIYVEELYDVALRQLIEDKTLTNLSDEIIEFKPTYIIPSHEPVTGILNRDESTLKKSDVGKRFLYLDGYSNNFATHNEDGSLEEDSTTEPEDTATKQDGGTPAAASEGPVAAEEPKKEETTPKNPKDGKIYVVTPFNLNGVRKYYYVPAKDQLGEPTVNSEDELTEVVFVEEDNLYYIKKDGVATPITLDFNNYKEQYRYSSTPWFLSQLMGDANNVALTKLFRFHTISDGTNSAFMAKVSIENIRPDAGTFDVVVRDLNDTDASTIVLEKFTGVNLVPGSPNYIAYRIGSFDEAYESKSNYITVEVNETDLTKVSIPCGFMGYPVRDYSGVSARAEGKTLQKPFLMYNTEVDNDIRIRKQYFGMSDLVGIDIDVLRYKGVEAYNNLPSGLTPCFHLDSRILNGMADKDGVISVKGVGVEEIKQTVSIDGITGYDWVTVGKGNTLGNFSKEPRIGSEADMYNTIYEDARYRKFTVCFYGGFDGWDYYRTSRSNGDTFKYQLYKGEINYKTGEGKVVSVIKDPELYGFDAAEKVNTSDYYAYLSAIRQFANPKEIDINVFATPGIDYVNNNQLVQETIEMIEEERADSIYVITTPDKPYGAGDSKSEMFTAEEAVANLEDSEIDSNWACTYYPWVKYLDSVNNQYIYLPPTKDVVKNFAYTDNVAAPWYAPAGWNRGLTDGVKSKRNLVLSEQNELYGGRINFVNNFADEGMRIWGDNNLQVAHSDAHMNKISKRRCLIRLRKLISIACVGLIFDPNDPTTVQSFRSAVEPILEDFISKRALTDAKLVVDDSEESRDRLELNAQIYLKFMPNLEYINIGLIATPNGVSFSDV